MTIFCKQIYKCFCIGKSLFSNLIGYSCNFDPFFISFTFFHILYVFRFQYFSLTEFSPMKLFSFRYCCIVFLHFSYSQSFPVLFFNHFLNFSLLGDTACLHNLFHHGFPDCSLIF